MPRVQFPLLPSFPAKTQLSDGTRYMPKRVNKYKADAKMNVLVREKTQDWITSPAAWRNLSGEH